MQKLLVLTGIFFILSSCSNQNKFQRLGTKTLIDSNTPYEVALKNAYKLGYNDGFNQGYEEGETYGENQGFSEGNQAGIRAGYRAGVEDGMKKKIKQSLIDRIEGDLLKSRKKILQEHYEDIGFKKGLKEGIQRTKRYIGNLEYEKGYEAGYLIGIKKKINSISYMEDVDLVPITKKYEPGYDYNIVVELIELINQKQDIQIFDSLLFIIHSDMLNFIINEIELDGVKKQIALNEYQDYHEDLSPFYFEAYNKSIAQTNINKTKEYNYYSTYYSTDILIDIISTGACSLFSGIIAIATLNPALAISISMASSILLKPLISQILSVFEDDLKKFALFDTFDFIKDSLISVTQDFIQEMIVLKYTYDEIVTKESSSKFFFNLLSANADVTLRIKTTVRYGFDVNKIICTLDHVRQEFTIFFPEIELMETSQDYEFLEVNDADWTDKIDEIFLNELFKTAKDIAKERSKILIMENESQVINTAERASVLSLQKLFYPIISFPKPYYKILICINNKTYDIYDV